MDERAKEARRLYFREWQRANKDRVRAAQERYWTRKAQELEQKSGENEEQTGND